MLKNHPLEKFRYCPVCGNARWVVNDFKSKRCEACAFVYYANAAAATAAIIVNSRGEMLAVRRAKEPAKGTLDLPGGFVDMGESIEQGMRREILEETGLQVTAMDYLFSLPNDYLYSGMTIHTVDAVFLVHVGDDVKPQAADDAADCLWIPVSDVNPADFGLTSIRRAVERFTQADKAPRVRDRKV
jgi:ADP-ribose pyrophosphatase YjhB (NUDIX family)